jgi:hypothetical protein
MLQSDNGQGADEGIAIARLLMPHCLTVSARQGARVSKHLPRLFCLLRAYVGEENDMKEKIKMPISFHGNFIVSITEGDDEKRGRCQKLFIKSLPGDRSGQSGGGDVAPRYRVTYFDFGCRYLIDGELVENEEGHVSFQAAGKVYTFSPAPVR